MLRDFFLSKFIFLIYTKRSRKYKKLALIIFLLRTISNMLIIDIFIINCNCIIFLFPSIITYNTRRFFPFLYKRYTFLRKLLFQFFFKLYLLYYHINFSFMFNLPQCNIMVVKIYSFLMFHLRFEVIIKELSFILCILLLSLVYSTLYCHGFIYGLLFVFARSTCYSSSLGCSLHIINRGIM